VHAPSDLNWFHRLRLRVLAILLGGFLAAFAMISFLAWPVLPVVGATVLTVAAVVHSVTGRLAQPICRTCGHDLTDQPTGVYGSLCPACGSVNQQHHRA
jgi:hypothetical protein